MVHTETKIAVALRNVSKRIRKSILVNDVSLEIPYGEVLGLLGPNGAGKTTTMRMIVGLMKRSAGEVIINGYSIQTQFKQAIRHIGAVVEEPQLYGYLSGYDNLVHFARMMPDNPVHRIK